MQLPFRLEKAVRYFALERAHIGVAVYTSHRLWRDELFCTTRKTVY